MRDTKAISPDSGAPEPGGTNRVLNDRGILDRPLSAVSCVTAWVIATALFFGMIALLGGPNESDASETVYTTWAIAHGDLACAYAPHATTTLSFFPEYQVGALSPPLWPLLSGGIAAVTRIGHEVPFPVPSALGTNCRNAYTTMYAWAGSVRALLPTTGIGYASWFVLLAGAVAALRAFGRGRRGWEAMGVILIGLSPVVWMPVLDYYHPEDILALGLILGGMACFRREKWVWAGVLLGLAVTSQQFAILALVPLVAVAPGFGRWKLAASSVVAWGAVTLPMVAVTSGRALGPAVFGTGVAGTFGGTVLWESGMRGAVLTFAARVLPVLIALTFALWIRRQLGTQALGALPLVSLIATSMSLRLAFEEGLFGYKFLALAVMLVLLAVVRGRISVPLIAWLALVTVAFNPVPVGSMVNARSWSHGAALAVVALCMVAGLAVIGWDATRHRVRWYLVGGFVLLLWAFWHLQPITPLGHAPLPLWLLQMVLVSSGIAAAVAPLASLLQHQVARATSAPRTLAAFGVRSLPARSQG